MRRLVTALALFLVPAAPAQAAALERDGFRYTRQLAPAPIGGPQVFEPDGPLFAHTRRGFRDLRIVDARSRQVPWRIRQSDERTGEQPAQVLNSGQEGGRAVALLDLGSQRLVRDRVHLALPDRGFVGRATVHGSDSREGPFTRLSATTIYDVGDARHARSTAALFPPSDFRYLMLEVTGVSRIAGATVSGAAERPRLIARPARSVTRREEGSETVVTLDLGHANLPVDELRIGARTSRYERDVTISGSNDGSRFRLLSPGRTSRFAGADPAPIAVDARHRYLRIAIENGDDAPLEDIRASAFSRSRALLVEGGHPGPYRLYYGNPHKPAPSYDFARIPEAALGLEGVPTAGLRDERPNPAFSPPPDRRSFASRHPNLVTGALALVAIALGAVGLLAVRNGRGPTAQR